ncbi:MAG TPA: tRNA uridine-5-carboxymethylaminomethyl(34) synthesis enzyme MnmG [Panacibacter sp.]|nr:tRNA uridine-5-carboxymethylaminomethyl(34) synthesis enzyme MnmG [Panacibacter sp.]HNP44685.1 tRNA uridine-5-carboxymethylaminomethyl(34) synthesis enzyme MnmG [Panacibacter sp.]
MHQNYDIIIVGAGHAGCEAAASAANLGSRVLLVTMNMQTIAQMSCNPAMGGIAKGQIIKEIDAIGGYSGIVTDKSMIQFRMLNKSKGPAMWSPRSQNDRMVFALTWRSMLEQTPNVDFYQDMVRSLIIHNDLVVGVETGLGHKIFSKAVIVTSGTFLNGIIHIGEKQFGGGRVAEKAATGITEQLIEFGFESDRLKTGTPPRVDGRSLNYSKMEEQKGDDIITGFSYLPLSRLKKEEQKSCFITFTNEAVHDSLKKGFNRSPMFTGRIEGIGPRYCPSIEDKINRFAERNRHQIFVEPEGFNTVEIYVNGFSTSLPEEVQYEALLKIPGFEKAKIFRPGYAIEYDFFPPTQLKHSLETKLLQNLFLAGQINGTTGYEEAACQGLMAGINAHLKINDRAALILKRSEAYIGVLIDDLVSKGTDEPYRMFTSRAEYRTLLRQDNADLRLTELSYKIGLASQERMDIVQKKKSAIEIIKSTLSSISLEPAEINPFLVSKDSTEIEEKQKASKILLRPNISMSDMVASIERIKPILREFTGEELEQAEIQIKYERYIEKEKDLVTRMSAVEELIIPDTFDYDKVSALSNEALQKFKRIKPRTLGQASRISGVNPSDVQILMVYMGR